MDKNITYIGIWEFQYLTTTITFYYLSECKNPTLLKQLLLHHELFY